MPDGGVGAAAVGVDPAVAVAPPQAKEGWEKPGAGRQTVTIGLLLTVGAIVLIVVASLVQSLAQSVLVPSAHVVVAARDVPLRARLGPDDVTLALVARKDVMPATYTRTDQVLNSTYIAAVGITKGQQITANMLARANSDVLGPLPAFLPIPTGFVAITIPDNPMAGVAGYVQAGDYINVILQIDPSVLASDKGGTVTRTVFTNLHVLRTGAAQRIESTNQAGNGGQGTYSTGANSLTVVTTQCDAEFLTWLLNHGQLIYTLGSYKDYQPQDKKPDPSCPTAGSTRGVGPADIEARWHLSALAGAALPSGDPAETASGGPVAPVSDQPAHG